jgi:hypothetical protein
MELVAWLPGLSKFRERTRDLFARQWPGTAEPEEMMTVRRDHPDHSRRVCLQDLGCIGWHRCRIHEERTKRRVIRRDRVRSVEIDDEDERRITDAVGRGC